MAAVVDAGLPAAHAGIAAGPLVVRDGDRPGDRWLALAGSALLVLLLAVNLRALVKSLLD